MFELRLEGWLGWVVGAFWARFVRKFLVSKIMFGEYLGSWMGVEWLGARWLGGFVSRWVD